MCLSQTVSCGGENLFFQTYELQKQIVPKKLFKVMRTSGRPSDTSRSSWKTALTIKCQCHTFARNNWTFHNALYCCFEICRIHFSRCHTLGISIWKCKSHLTSSTTFLPMIDHLKLSPLTAFPSHHQQKKNMLETLCVTQLQMMKLKLDKIHWFLYTYQQGTQYRATVCI